MKTATPISQAGFVKGNAEEKTDVKMGFDW